MHRVIRLCAASSVLVTLTSCGTYQIQQETGRIALDLPEPQSRPRPTIYDGHGVDLSNASVIALANMVATTHPNRVDDTLQEMYWRACGLGADVLLLGHIDSQVVGATTQYIGFGAYYSAPVYSHRYQAVAYRFATKSLGFGWNENLRVTSVGEVAAESGVRKGDEVTSIDGVIIRTYKSTQDALRDPLNGYVESLEIGTGVSVDLVREGVGPLTVSIPVQRWTSGHVTGPGSSLARYIDRDEPPDRVLWPAYSNNGVPPRPGVGGSLHSLDKYRADRRATSVRVENVEGGTWTHYQ